MPGTPFDVVTWDTVQPIFLGVIALLVVGFIAFVLPYRRAPTRKNTAAVIVMAAALATAGGVYAFDAYYVYASNNTWWFQYTVSLEGNGSAPEAMIVPVPRDETLLAHLKLESGSANWSLVDTPYGRGLFVRFTGSALLDTYVSEFPPPGDPSSGDPTMTQASNCTAPQGNCTGAPAPQLWMFYSGTAGVQVVFLTTSVGVRAYPAPGWAPYESRFYPP